VTFCATKVDPNYVACYLGTGEHGVGVGKKEFLVDELGDGTIRLMRTIKKAIDPYNLFNPGKVGIVMLFPLTSAHTTCCLAVPRCQGSELVGAYLSLCCCQVEHMQADPFVCAGQEQLNWIEA
jgi:hypothetical protein